jgi:hypothetical protein
MTYPHLRIGDRLPIVAVMQKLLGHNLGERVELSGRYSHSTRQALERFQRSRHLYESGSRLNLSTWLALMNLPAHALRLSIIDLVDQTSSTFFSHENDADNIRSEGGEPIILNGDAGGVEVAVHEIMRVAGGRPICLLRIHGHGGDGDISFSTGLGADPDGLSSINPSNLERLRPILMELRPLLYPYGCIQFMHCLIAHSSVGEGLLDEIANMLSVPVTGARNPQLSGGFGDATFRYEGPYYTAVPSGLSLDAWAASLPGYDHRAFYVDADDIGSDRYSMGPGRHR